MTDTVDKYQGFRERMNERLIKVTSLKGDAVFDSARLQEALQPVLKMNKSKVKEK